MMRIVVLLVISFIYISCNTISTICFYKEREIESCLLRHLDSLHTGEYEWCSGRSNVNLRFFENADSVQRSIGYSLFDELTTRARVNVVKNQYRSYDECTVPYIDISDLVFDRTKKYFIVSYRVCSGPLSAEEVCGVFQIIRDLKSHKSVLKLKWAQRISVS